MIDLELDYRTIIVRGFKKDFDRFREAVESKWKKCEVSQVEDVVYIDYKYDPYPIYFHDLYTINKNL